MSEYQYYEFRALDRPLSDKAQAELRGLSSRAEITATSFVNTYNYGDFRGKPDKLMEKYFDAFLYVANWPAHRLMLRLPRRLFDLKEGKAYAVTDSVKFHDTGEHVVVDFDAHPEDGPSGWEEGEGQLEPLLPLRADLMAGDWRALYIGWLAAAERGELDDDKREPPVPPGLSQLTPALKALAEFLWLDKDLLAAAAASDEGTAPTGPGADEVAAWVTALPAKEKDALLLRLLAGDAPHLSLELRRRFQEAQTAQRPPSHSAQPRRTVAELLAAAEEVRAESKRRATAKAARIMVAKAREKAAARALYLDSLVGKEDALWPQVDKAIQTKLPKEYDRAVDLLLALHDLAVRSGTQAEVGQRIRNLREQHKAKRTFVQRLDKAELP